MVFVRASAKHGRRAYDRIAAEVGKSEKEVRSSCPVLHRSLEVVNFDKSRWSCFPFLLAGGEGGVKKTVA